MGKRSFISLSAISRWMSARRSYAKEKERINLIEEQSSCKKELPPTFSLVHMDFNPETRNTKLEFTQTQQYRTIERYVTQNYVRYPVYSDWKVKSKTIKKSIKLTNQALEQLNLNDDSLIRKFCKEIVYALNSDDLIPSWFVKAYLRDELNDKDKELQKQLELYCEEKDALIKQCNVRISDNNQKIYAIKKPLIKFDRKRYKIDHKLTKTKSAKKSIFLYIITFGFYRYYISKVRSNKLNDKLTYLNEKISDLTKQNQDLANDNDRQNSLISQYNVDKKQKNSELQKKKEKYQAEYEAKLKQVIPLNCEYVPDQSFIPLKVVVGYEYKKIIGCYIIHNKENDKYYVGQSKDIMKRIKQHFKGTVPNNIIFAQDYYTSELKDKSDLFEIKIVPCETKDELDRTEKELIYEYDSWTNGYNGTSGNT